MKTLLGTAALKLLKKYRLPVVKSKMINNVNKLKVPCVLKAISPDIVHKTEKNAVQIIHCEKDLSKAYDYLSKLGKVMYQPLVDGRELIIGIKNDKTFGPVLMFGLGGIYTEVFKDISFRVCPIEDKDAEEMISEIKSSKALGKFRGKPAIKFNLLKKTLVRVSKLAMKEQIEELDINPFIINNKKGYAVDARIVLK